MTTRSARRTVRTARSAGLVALAAAAAFSLTACGGSKDAAAGPKVTVAAAHATGGVGVPGGTGAGGGESPTGTRNETPVSSRTGASAGTAKGSSPVRTQTLPDGSKAEIYRLGAQHYRAKIVNRGSVLATLEANGRDAGLDGNDMFIVLTLDGRVHAWLGGGHQGPGTFRLAGGWTAEVTKLGELRYRARIIGHDGVAATMQANQHDAGLDANGIFIVLSDGGVISAHA
ncbi:hypothetical protein ACF09H_35695 [Streptomyces sp. NPDC014983]|uniref:hypothetical protein n=1 Tax=Streptomyces sp. NPDC014983 TaxID=3364933 RepID=UPI00370005B1